MNIENSKNIAEYYATSSYVRSNNETNEKINQVQEHIKYLYNAILPNLQYKALEFQTLNPPPFPSILNQQQPKITNSTSHPPFNQVPQSLATNLHFENNSLQRK